MAAIHGNAGTVYSGATAVGEITGWSMSINADKAEDTSMGDTWKSHQYGHQLADVSVDFHYDPADAGQITIDVGSSVTINLHSDGDATGDDEWVCVIGIDNYEVTSAMTDIVSAKFTGQGSAVQGTVPA